MIQRREQYPSLFGGLSGILRKANNAVKSSRTLGGVYVMSGSDTDSQSSTSCKSLHTIKTTSDEPQIHDWNTSGEADHHKGAPRLAKTFSMRRINPNNITLTDEQLMGRVMLKVRRLPKANGYCMSNHVMINCERGERHIAPLKRVRTMDELAQQQAQRMAAMGKLCYSDVDELEAEVSGGQCGRRIGENVGKGKDIASIQAAMRRTKADLNNIIDRRFTCMGVGTARAEDGTIYLCQIFSD